jgi:2',3'-cyclic-nucleotide 2'-phosphodiesterase (5'-nucleotidase family)
MTARKFFLILISLFIIAACCRVATVSKTDYQPIVVDKLHAGNDAVSDSIIKPYYEKVSSYMNLVIGYSDTLMWTAKPEGMLGNFISDLLLTEANNAVAEKNDMALFNNGGLRVPINKGAITVADIFRLMPFENEMVIIKLKGTVVKDMLDYIAKSEGQPVSGLRFGIKDSKAVHILIGGEQLDTNKLYRVVTSDYLARGGDKMVFFLKGLETYQTGLKVRDVIIDFIRNKNKAGEKISGRTDGRIYKINP